jgi:HEAT repeat protein
MDSILKSIELLDTNNSVSIEHIIVELADQSKDIDNIIIEYLRTEKRENVIYNLIVVVSRRKETSDEMIALLTEFAEKSNNHMIRELAFHALGKLGSYKLVARAIEMLKTEPVDGVRESMVRLIGELTAKYPLQVLIECLTDEDTFVREAAAEAILSIYEQPIVLLIEALKQAKSNEHKVEIIEALRMTQSRLAVPVLTTMADDEDKNIRRVVEFALREIS